MSISWVELGAGGIEEEVVDREELEGEKVGSENRRRARFTHNLLT